MPNNVNPVLTTSKQLAGDQRLRAGFTAIGGIDTYPGLLGDALDNFAGRAMTGLAAITRLTTIFAYLEQRGYTGDRTYLYTEVAPNMLGVIFASYPETAQAAREYWLASLQSN